VYDFGPSIFKMNRAVWLHFSIIIQSAILLDNNAGDNIVTISEDECQQSANIASTERQWFLILHFECSKGNGMQLTHNEPTSSLCRQQCCDDIVSASNNWAPMECQQFLWRLSKLHSNEVHCAVPKLCFTRSVFAICPWYNFTNMHAMPHRSDFFACSSRVNI